MPVKEIKEYLHELKNSSSVYETVLLSPTSYECVISNANIFGARMLSPLSYKGIAIENKELTYHISIPSKKYMIWLFISLQSIFDQRFLSHRFRYIIDEGDDAYEMEILSEKLKVKKNSIFILLYYLLPPRLMTLEINTQKPHTYQKLQSLVSSFLFHVSYNLGQTFVTKHYIDEILNRRLVKNMRRNEISNLSGPCRTYNEELVYHYLSATSSDNLTSQYLSYYHIIEHFFDSIFNDELIDSIQNKITKPDFSYKRKKDINDLIQSLKKSFIIRENTITFSESNALKLCISKLVNIDELIEDINDYDSNLLDYYKNNKVSFSDGNCIDFNTDQHDHIIRELSNRVYKTRCALVHSKENHEKKFQPFKDEKTLLMEIPLIRLLSERIIISTSTLL